MFQSTGSVVTQGQSPTRAEVISTDGVDAKGYLSLRSGNHSQSGSKCNKDQTPERCKSGKVCKLSSGRAKAHQHYQVFMQRKSQEHVASTAREQPIQPNASILRQSAFM